MKSRIGATLLALAGLARAGGDDHWTFGGHVGANASGGVTRTEMALSAEYALGNLLSWRTDLAFVFRDAKNQDVFDLNVPTNLLLWPAGRNARVRPYLGPGANWSRSHEGINTLGFNALAGLQLVSAGSTTFGVEGKYLVPDLTDPKSRAQTSLSLTGAFQVRK